MDLCDIFCKKRIDQLNNQIEEAMNRNAILLTERENIQFQLEATIDGAIKTKKDLVAKIAEYESQLQNNLALILTYQEQLSQFKKIAIPVNIQQLINTMNKKYETKQITHASYMFAKSNNNFQMDIRNWITPYDKVVESWADTKKIITLNDELNKGVAYHKACDNVVNSVIQNWIPNYKFDNKEWELFKLGDMWQMPFQTIKTNFTGDCEDLSNTLISVMINRGVPNGLIRNSCGVTVSNTGHSTVHYLASDLNWRHIEATSRNKRDILTLPDIHDKKDSSNIQTVWYSFNWDNSWSQWDSTEQTSSYKKFKRNKYTIIKR